MGSERNLDKFVVGRILEAVLQGAGRSADSAIQGAANINPDTYREYKEVLLSTKDIDLSPRADGKLVPVLTPDGMETLRSCRRDFQRFGKENLVVEEIRRKHAELRRARKNRTETTDSAEDGASDT